MARLTKTIVEGAPAKDRQYTVWCSELQGFGIYVHPTGRRSYFVDYRTTAGARRRQTIGRHGIFTVDGARKAAISILGRVADGEDPLDDRAAQRAAMTMQQLCDLYWDAAQSGLILGKGGRAKKVSTLLTDRGRIDGHILPLLGKLRVQELTSGDVNRFIRDVANGKTAATQRTGKVRGKSIVRGGIGAASRTTGLLGGILSFAVAEGIIERNPSVGVRRPADNARSRRLSREEYRQLGCALDSTSSLPSQGRAAIILIALTGCRSSEVTRLRWDEVDFEGASLRLTDSKEGRSVRPMGADALRLLKGLQRVEGIPFVLPPIRCGESFGGLPGAWTKVAANAKLDGVTPHTLRHSFASVAGDLGLADSTISALLGHSTHSVTSRYVHRLDSVLIAAADRVASEISTMLWEGDP